MANDDEPVEVPARYSRVDPWVISLDTEAEIAFLATVFEGKETPGSRMVGPDGRIVYSDRPPAEGRLENTMAFENLPSSPLPSAKG